MIDIKVKVLKETKALEKKLDLTANALMRNLQKARDQSGDHLERETKKTIFNQNFVPLVEWWRKKKQREGFDTRILLRAHILINMIRYRRYQTSANAIIGGVTVLDRTYPNEERLLKKPRKNRISKSQRSATSMTQERVKRQATGKSVRRIAEYHEGGIGRNPERPFFRQTYLREAPAVIQYFLNAVSEAMGRLKA